MKRIFVTTVFVMLMFACNAVITQAETSSPSLSEPAADSPYYSADGRLHPDGSASGEASFADGVYYIASKLNINMRFDVAYGGTSNGTNLWLYSSNESIAQQFRITRQSDGKTYRLQAVCNDLYIDNGGSSANDFNTHMWEWENTGAQLWYITDAGNGWYTFVNHDSGLVLDVQNGNTANGTNIQQHTSNGTDSQKFRLIPVGNADISDGVYNIESKLNTNMCLDVAGAKTGNGTNLWLFHNHRSKTQQFRVTKQSDGKTYRLQAVCNDLYIDNGASLDIDFNTHMWESISTGAQMWYIIDTGNGWYSIINHDSGLALDVENGNASSGTNIRQHTYNGSDAQKWRFVHAHTLTEVASKAATTTSKGNIEYWKCDSCGKLFEDSKGEKEISYAQTVISKLPDNQTGESTQPSKTDKNDKTGVSTQPSKDDKTGESTQPSKDDKTGVSTQPSKDDKTGVSTQPSKTDKTGVSTQPSKDDKTGESTQPSKTDKTGISTEQSKTDKTGISTEQSKTDKTGISTEQSKTDKTGISTEQSKTDKNDKTGISTEQSNTDMNDKTGVSTQPSKTDKTGISTEQSKTDKNDKTGISTEQGKTDKNDKTGISTEQSKTDKTGISTEQSKTDKTDKTGESTEQSKTDKTDKTGVSTEQSKTDKTDETGESTEPSKTDKKDKTGESAEPSEAQTDVQESDGDAISWYFIRKSWEDAKSQKGAYKNLDKAKKYVDQNPGYKVFDKDGKVVYEPDSSELEVKVPFMVNVDIPNLNIRTGPGDEYDWVKICPAGVYTITEVKAGQGSEAGWGRLKSGIGWISLDLISII